MANHCTEFELAQQEAMLGPVHGLRDAGMHTDEPFAGGEDEVSIGNSCMLMTRCLHPRLVRLGKVARDVLPESTRAVVCEDIDGPCAFPNCPLSTMDNESSSVDEMKVAPRSKNGVCDKNCTLVVQRGPRGGWVDMCCPRHPRCAPQVGSKLGGGKNASAQDICMLSKCYHCQAPTEAMITWTGILVSGGCATCTMHMAWAGLKPLAPRGPAYEVRTAQRIDKDTITFDGGIHIDDWVAQFIEHRGMPDKFPKFMHDVDGQSVELANSWKPVERLVRENLRKAKRRVRRRARRRARPY